jgi:hypothetical protein
VRSYLIILVKIKLLHAHTPALPSSFPIFFSLVLMPMEFYYISLITYTHATI